MTRHAGAAHHVIFPRLSKREMVRVREGAPGTAPRTHEVKLGVRLAAVGSKGLDVVWLICYPSMMALIRIHLTKDRQRTTVSMERVLADVLSLHLCGRLEVTTVRGWCQKEIEKDPGAYAVSASQRLASRAVLEIAPKGLQEKYWDALESGGKAKKLSEGRRKGETRPAVKRGAPADRRK